MISTEKLSALICAIHDCALAPDRWAATLQSIRAELFFATAVLAVNPLPAGDLTIFATSGIAPEWLGRMWGYGEETLELWGRSRAHQSVSIGRADRPVTGYGSCDVEGRSLDHGMGISAGTVGCGGLRLCQRPER